MNINRFLVLTAFVCGMATMALELAATRLLAPFFGSSMVIWTVVIGVFLLALSLGNWWGGQLADRSEKPDRFFHLLAASAIWLALVPLVGKFLMSATAVVLAFVFPHQLLLTGSALVCLVLFTFPFTVLGMATPFLVRHAVDDLGHAGRVTGRLQAANCLGSLIGTALPVFVTIPWLGTARTFWLFAACLLLLALAHPWMSGARPSGRRLVGTAAVLGLLLSPWQPAVAFWAKPIFEGESPYNYVLVDRHDDTIVFSTHVAVGMQSCYRPGYRLSDGYYDYALGGLWTLPDLTASSPLRTLVLGMGAGTFSRQCHDFFPLSVNHGVEIDPTVARLAREHLGWRDEHGTMFVDDGRTFLRRPEAGLYDAILVDAYRDISQPFHMCTREFFTEVGAHLATDGIVILNVNVRAPGARELLDALAATLRAAIGPVWECDTPDDANTLLFATRDPGGLTRFRRQRRALPDDHPLASVTAWLDERGRPAIATDALVLTDDRAPVEILAQRAVDAVIRHYSRVLGTAVTAVIASATTDPAGTDGAAGSRRDDAGGPASAAAGLDPAPRSGTDDAAPVAPDPATTREDDDGEESGGSS